MVDQRRVDKLPHDQFSTQYDDGMWRRSRENHVEALIELYKTVDDMPPLLLNRLTELAVTFDPATVKYEFSNAINEAGTGAASPELYETAPLFFGEIITAVSRKRQSRSLVQNAVEQMFEWFDYDDPLQIAFDPECEYVEILAAQIESEVPEKMKKLARSCRSRFAKMIENSIISTG